VASDHVALIDKVKLASFIWLKYMLRLFLATMNGGATRYIVWV